MNIKQTFHAGWLYAVITFSNVDEKLNLIEYEKCENFIFLHPK